MLNVEDCFDVSEGESDEDWDTKKIPLKLVENLSRTIPHIYFWDDTVKSGEETERILHKILHMHLTRVL